MTAGGEKPCRVRVGAALGLEYIDMALAFCLRPRRAHLLRLAVTLQG